VDVALVTITESNLNLILLSLAMLAQFTSSLSGVGCLKLADGSITNDPREKVELLNNYFSSAFTVNDGSCPVLPSRTTVGERLLSVSFTASKVFRKPGILKPGTADTGYITKTCE